jgi:hypothetical protein
MYPIRPTTPGVIPGANAPRDPRVRVEQQRTPGNAPARIAPNAHPTAPAATVVSSPASLPAQAPAGTDPELWSVLSPDERAFFAKVGAMGPLTYGRALAQQPAAPIARGGRLDVKV